MESKRPKWAEVNSASKEQEPRNRPPRNQNQGRGPPKDQKRLQITDHFHEERTSNDQR